MEAHWIQLFVVTVLAAASIFAVGYWIEGRTAALRSQRARQFDSEQQEQRR